MTRVLFFAPRDCRPPNTGTKLRNFHLCRELSRHAHVTYLSFEEPGGEVDEIGAPGDIAARVITVPHGSLSSPLQLARGLVGTWPLTVLNYTTPAMQTRLAALLAEQDFDLVLVQSLLLAAYVPQLRAAKSRPLLICDWHNVDSEVLERYAQHAPNWPRKIYALATARRLAKLERDQMPRFNAHLTVSERDTAHLHTLMAAAPVWTLENGTETSGFAAGEVGGAQVRRYAERRQGDRRQLYRALAPGQSDRRQGDRRQGPRRESGPPHRILFVGSMDYHPNIDAACHFAREIWPQIHAARPDWRFTIVGRDPASAVCDLAETPGIEVTGTVPDVRPFYREALASVVPLRVGGGSRLKILEAMAARVPVVSSTLGAEGLAVADGQTILIRDDAEATARALLDLAADTPRRVALVEAAHELVMQRYDWSAIGTQLRAICAGLLEEKFGPEAAAFAPKIIPATDPKIAASISETTEVLPRPGAPFEARSNSEAARPEPENRAAEVNLASAQAGTEFATETAISPHKGAESKTQAADLPATEAVFAAGFEGETEPDFLAELDANFAAKPVANESDANESNAAEPVAGESVAGEPVAPATEIEAVAHSKSPTGAAKTDGQPNSNQAKSGFDAVAP